MGTIIRTVRVSDLPERSRVAGLGEETVRIVERPRDATDRRPRQRAFAGRVRAVLAEQGDRTLTIEDAVNRIRALRDEWPD